MRRHWTKAILLSFGLVALVLCAVYALRTSPQGQVGYLLHEVARTNVLSAQNSLQKMGIQAMPYLLREATGRQPLSRRIYQALWSRFPTRLQQRLPRPYEQKRVLALQVLSFPGMTSATAIPVLVRLLDDPDRAVRDYAVLALSNLGSTHPLAIAALMRALQNSPAPSLSRGTNYVRETATRALGNMGRAAKVGAPDLTELLNDGQASVRQEAAIALWRINGETTILPVLIASLATATNGADRANSAISARTCRRILQTLEEIGPSAKPAVPEALRTIEHAGDWPRPWSGMILGSARQALARIDPEAAAQGSFRVAIFDAKSGRPIGGAQVTVAARDEKRRFTKPLTNAMSDVKGIARVVGLPAGQFQVSAGATGYVEVVVAYQDYPAHSFEQVEIALARAGSVTGIAVDERGAGVPNLRLVAARTLISMNRPYRPLNQPETTTDSEGRFTLTGLPIGLVQIQVRSTNYFQADISRLEPVPATGLSIQVARTRYSPAPKTNSTILQPQ